MKIFGPGIPSKIKPAGTEYVDTKSGIRYNQNKAPQGNQWTPMDDDVSNDSGGGLISYPSGVLYYIEKELNQTELLGLNQNDTPILLGSVPSNTEYLTYHLTDVFFLFSGTTVTSSGRIDIVSDDYNTLLFIAAKSIFTSDFVSTINIKNSDRLNQAQLKILSTNPTNIYIQSTGTMGGGSSDSWAKIVVLFTCYQ